MESYPGIYSTALMFRMPEVKARTVSTAALAYATKEAQEVLTDSYEGKRDFYCGGVNLDWVPEYDEFDTETRQLKRKGWRSIVLHLANMKLVDLDRAKQVFQMTSLGESDWDRLSYEQKIKRIIETENA